jgi:glycosyltransferase involved in cell wall biosynthesis
MTLESYFYYLMPYYRNVDMFMFQSNFTRDIFVRYGFDKNRSHVIENPFDCSSLTPSFTGKNYILYFGRISAEKGIMTLIQAMKFLPDMELQIVGNGPEYDPYLKYTFDNGIQNVKFLGPKWDKDLEPVLKNCDFVIVPSEWYDPSPYVVLQANAYGKPVIASRIGGLQDSVIDNETGVLFEPGNVLDLVDKITSLKNDRNLIMRLGRNARLLVESRNEPERYYNDTIGLFNNLT